MRTQKVQDTVGVEDPLGFEGEALDDEAQGPLVVEDPQRLEGEALDDVAQDRVGVEGFLASKKKVSEGEESCSGPLRVVCMSLSWILCLWKGEYKKEYII